MWNAVISVRLEDSAPVAIVSGTFRLVGGELRSVQLRPCKCENIAILRGRARQSFIHNILTLANYLSNPPLASIHAINVPVTLDSTSALPRSS